MKYAALCCIAKDEDPFLKEWIACHAAIGFEHFIIYDNLSTVPVADFLQGFVPAENLTVIRNKEPLRQEIVYTDCLARFGKTFQWIAFFDVDEILHLPNAQDIRVFLADYEPYAAIGVNWRMFGSNGHDKRPDGLLINNYTSWLYDDTHIKSIVQPLRVVKCINPHAFTFVSGERGATPNHEVLPSEFPFMLPETENIRLHHYFYKSRQCFEEKIAKGNPCNIQRGMDEFEKHRGSPTHTDTGLRKISGTVLHSILRDKALLPIHPDAQETNTTGYLTAAKKHLAAENFFQAELCLAYAKMYAQNPLVIHKIWVLRAQSARLQKRMQSAKLSLDQALILAPSAEALLELANLSLVTNKKKKAQKLLGMLKVYTRQAP